MMKEWLQEKSIFVFFFPLIKYSSTKKKKKIECKDKRTRPRSEKGGRGTEQLVRSRSYPGFSIGILLSVKMILPVNSVFIPLLNEIHRSMERGGGRERERHDKEKRKLPLPSLSLFLPPSSLQFVLPLDIQ